MPSLCRGSKAHPWSWVQGRASAERQPKRSARCRVRCCHLPSPPQDCRDGCCFPGSKPCHAALGSRRQALEEGGSQAKLTELLEGCTEIPTQRKEASIRQRSASLLCSGGSCSLLVRAVLLGAVFAF